MDTDVAELGGLVRQAVATLSSSDDGAEIASALVVARQCLGSVAGKGSSGRERRALATLHAGLLQTLAASPTGGWLRLLPADQRLDLLHGCFLAASPRLAFLTMVDAIAAHSGGGGGHCVPILEQFLQEERMVRLLCEAGDAETLLADREVLLTRITALPDHSANKLQRANRPLFYPENYYPLLAREMLAALGRIHQSLRDGSDSSVSFLSQLLGKVCVQGHSDTVLQVLVPRLALLTQSDGVWQRICWRLVEDVPERWMESVVAGVVRATAGPEVLSRLLGSIVLKNKKAEFVLTHKFLLLQYHHKTCVLQNLLGYLAREKSGRCLLEEVLRRLLTAWGCRASVRHSPVEQQAYISRAITVCLGLLSPTQLEEQRTELLSLTLAGVECRLGSSLPRVRRLGMVVAECVSDRINAGPHPLNFQYEDDDETREVRSLCSPRPPSSWESPPQSHRSEGLQTDSGETPADVGSPGQTEQSGPESELDSDDELVPYDLSGDSELGEGSAPAYLTGCLEVLLNLESAGRVGATLNALERLVRRNPSAAREVGEELTKVLLHLEDRFATPGFEGLRQQAMVALAVTGTVPVVQYLTAEFYAVNYSLSQRLHILDVLALAAQELADPGLRAKGGDSTGEGGSPHPQLPDPPSADPSPGWRQIVEQRLQSKTRRLSKGVWTPGPQATANRFAPVAGHFFFPLINNYDRPQTVYDFLAEEPLVLGRLVHTLGLLVFLALHAPIAIHLGKALFGFIWALRYHPDTYVRQGTLFAMSSLLLSVPSDRLLEDVPDELLEARLWLTDVAERDPDDTCRRQALQSLVLLGNFQKKLAGLPE